MGVRGQLYMIILHEKQAYLWRKRQTGGLVLVDTGVKVSGGVGRCRDRVSECRARAQAVGLLSGAVGARAQLAARRCEENDSDWALPVARFKARCVRAGYGFRYCDRKFDASRARDRRDARVQNLFL